MPRFFVPVMWRRQALCGAGTPARESREAASLFVPQSFDGIQVRGPRRWNHAADDADQREKNLQHGSHDTELRELLLSIKNMDRAFVIRPEAMGSGEGVFDCLRHLVVIQAG